VSKTDRVREFVFGLTNNVGNAPVQKNQGWYNFCLAKRQGPKEHTVTLPDSEERPEGPSRADAASRAAEVALLFREHNRTLVLYLAARLKDIQSAREVAQEAYVRLLQLESTGTVSFLRAYLFKIASNIAIDRLRQQQTRSRLDQPREWDDIFIEPSTERTLIAREELVHLGQLVTELPEKYQQAFRLHRLEDHSFADIARHMGIKERMVRRYVTNTLVYLRLRRAGVSRADAWRQLHA
jgi:RNA polymerase sigma factor (sigma-70 family)